MRSTFDMLLAVYDRAALMLICLFFLTRTRHFRQLLQQDEHSRFDLAVVTAIFPCSRCLAPGPVSMWKARW